MPELPEVETIRAHLAPRLEGRVLSRVEILDPRLTRPYDLFEVAEELEDGRVVAVERRGKYLILRLESGLTLLVHLRMTGGFHWRPVTHERAVLELDDGSRLAYRDVRRFGTWLVLEGANLEPYLGAKNGPEPLGSRFTSAWLGEQLARRRGALKPVLLDQRVVAGLGNIYADEALWRSRLSPLRPANELTGDDVGRLTRAIRAALRTGIERQGSTLRDYSQPDGSSGSMQDEFRAYGRDGLPCPRCRTTISKTRVGGRGTWFCPRCQPLPAGGSLAPMDERKLEHAFTSVDEQDDPGEWIGVLDRVRQEPAYAAYKARIGELLRPVESGVYLDVGAGTGDDALALAERHSVRVVGVDSSETMVAEALERGLSEARVADAHALPFPDASFDGCWADRVFQHLADPAAALTELVRVTKPGGRIVLADPDYGTQSVELEDQELARRILRFRAERMLRNGTLAHRLGELFASVGLDDVTVEPVPIVLRDPTALDNAMGLRSWASTAHEHGVVTESDTRAWESQLGAAVAEGRFLYSFTIFLTAGTKP